MGTWPIKVMVKDGLCSMFLSLGHEGLKSKRKTDSNKTQKTRKLSSA